MLHSLSKMWGHRTSSWPRSHFGPVIGPSFPEANLHFILAFRQEKLWTGDVTMGWEPHHSLDVLSSRWRWALYIPSIYCSTFHQGSLTSQVSGAFWWVHPRSYYLRLPVYILCAGPQGFVPLSPATPHKPLFNNIITDTIKLSTKEKIAWFYFL